MAIMVMMASSEELLEAAARPNSLKSIYESAYCSVQETLERFGWYQEFGSGCSRRRAVDLWMAVLESSKGQGSQKCPM